MTDGRAWQGNWKDRLYKRVRERGFASLTAFAEARPAIPLYALAEELGEEDVAAVQVLSGLLAEAEQCNQVTRFERDVLVRQLSQSLPNGWPPVMDDSSRFAVAKALARWIGYTPEVHQERARQVMAAILARPPHPGWRPLGPDDELIRMFWPDEDT
ncbi:NUDIX hydrolase [Melittangium boletus]|uniref:NUDIX hydrolase n=1 Tax=Melittangium boletus TaxID=83453 RepID=UPI000BB3D905|nr:NUDIX hydrolase [Melittangium boletus]